jgi:large subunit ribosomal protein L1
MLKGFAMAKHGKKYRLMHEALGSTQAVTVKQALESLKKFAYAKFDESVDVDINLGIDPSKGEQVVRGSVILPHTIGKKVRVIVFAKSDYADAAHKAGADVVGVEDLVEKIEGGWLDFDVAVATPDLMGTVSKLAKLLGPKGLLPNKKLGTVTFDIESVVTDLKKGRAFFKNDKSGLVHFKIGKVSLDIQKLAENFDAFYKALSISKPAASKGKFIQKITLTSSMGAGIEIAPEEALRDR